MDTIRTRDIIALTLGTIGGVTFMAGTGALGFGLDLLGAALITASLVLILAATLTARRA